MSDNKPDLTIVRLDMGSHQCVHLVKMFGPLSMCDIRIWTDCVTGEWIIERARESGKWEVCARVLGCLDDDFIEERPKP